MVRNPLHDREGLQRPGAQNPAHPVEWSDGCHSRLDGATNPLLVVLGLVGTVAGHDTYGRLGPPQHVPQREAVIVDLDLVESGRGEQHLELVALVTSDMSDRSIGITKLPLVRWHGDENPTTRADLGEPRLQDAEIVLDVFENFESEEMVDRGIGDRVEMLDDPNRSVEPTAEDPEGMLTQIVRRDFKPAIDEAPRDVAGPCADFEDRAR